MKPLRPGLCRSRPALLQSRLPVAQPPHSSRPSHNAPSCSSRHRSGSCRGPGHPRGAARRGADTRQPRHQGGSGRGPPAPGLGSTTGEIGGEKQEEAGKAQDGGCGTAMGCARSLGRDEKSPGRGEERERAGRPCRSSRGSARNRG